MSNTISPLQLAFYKGVTGKWGALQFNLQRPHYYCAQCKAKVYDSKYAPDPCVNTNDSNSPCSAGRMKSREGAIFMEITSARGKNDYDWDNKIVMALSIEDMSQILCVLEGCDGGNGECKLMHDPGAKTASQGKVQKWLDITTPKGIQVGCMFTARMKQTDGDPISHTVPLNASEVKRLAACLRNAIPVAVAWV